MTCFADILISPIFLGVLGVSAVAAFVMVWMLKFQRFSAKPYYAMAFVALIWTLIVVGAEAASDDFTCQYRFAISAWLGNATVPVAWCFFIFGYIDNAPWVAKRWVYAVPAVITATVFALAATNQWHHLVYADGTGMWPGQDHVTYVHGPGFYVIIATLYSFVMATLWCLLRAFTRSRFSAWPFLGVLVAVTITPLVTNAAYVMFGFTIFGLDPTAFMFTFAVVAFSSLLVTNKTLDMATVGPSILFDTMSEPVVLIDRTYNIVQMNSAAKRSGLHDGSGHLLKEVLKNIERSNTSEEVENLEISDRFYEPRIQEVASPLDPARAILGWSITFVDITDRIAISAELERAVEAADQANEAKDEFVSVVSHEMRTPLTSLTGGLALALSDRFGDVSAPLKSLLEIAHRNGRRLSRLVDNILLAQKIDIGALPLDTKRVDLGGLLHESLEENKMFASTRGVRFVTKKNDTTAFIVGDAFALRQIVDNLVSNAIKFSKENGVVEGALMIDNGRARLSIKDSGRGIPEGMESQVFGHFEQVKSSGQSSTQGSGLGLHISKKLAQQMSGDVFYDSEVGVGSTFHVEFALVDEGDTEPAQLAG
ncbi:Signal transduction histidine kinase [Sulfitobacter marinus]|uniref:histidine kinase n=1 Tax=Sulfitobacter marinus TaxID=394264 RepID=A0A1I6QZ54_9RHOB|nr:histidine kinase N-terminal 7TM domain-containing protein [Sulfitobacter marinus]SFS57703.1 Signal transduction histidine kinase [Sulfitobacter marinus]